ncbi:hypothetical protein [Aeoliella mucimassa]|uniref:Uncharacterized protein n=1 Tax=Aeoliella mucimassa TaxID=2527972 RepID=A0A518AVQ0_9BACT|nr:hypothetical protein [Aeoliella mucimassa]QDU58796.1 hypothetical protein Pan181_50360 [Aeoliella mucimassa]
MSRVLPDRDQRHLLQFYLMSQINYNQRLLWAAGIIAAGLLMQMCWPADSLESVLVITLPMLLFGTLMLLVRGYDLKPRYNVRFGTWEKTTREQFTTARLLQSNVSSWDQAFVDITSPLGAFGLAITGGAVLLAVAAVAADRSTSMWAPVIGLDAAVLLLPHWFVGTKRGWRPVSLNQEIQALETALRAIEPYEDPPCQIQPMFQLAGKGETKTPIGARVFIRFPDGPEDLLGVQLQVAINDVQGTKYPYLYAVIVAKKSFGLLGQPLRECQVRMNPKKKRQTGLLDWLSGGTPVGRMTVEGKSEDDVDVIVIRQHTTKKSGYHTSDATVARIAASAWRIASEMATAKKVR